MAPESAVCSSAGGPSIVSTMIGTPGAMRDGTEASKPTSWHAASASGARQAATGRYLKKKPIPIARLPARMAWSLVINTPPPALLNRQVRASIALTDHEVEASSVQGLGALLADERGPPDAHRGRARDIHQDHVQ